MSKSPSQLLQQYWQIGLYLLGGILLRVWNFQNSLYFIYDQGRDAWVFEKIAHGDFILIGPTSGLPGFFLGPLWYYIGLPGYLLSGGNPYGICLWYIAISCLALPLFWILAHRLFKEKVWAVLCAIFLAIVPGSIQASIFIWNPLLSVPLMAGALLAIEKARQSRRWLATVFFLLALTLQSEFAYAIFFLPILFILIPWIRRKFDWRDFAVVIGAVGITAIPQLLFELRNRFIMTTSLLKSMSDTSQAVTWQGLWAIRPHQLLNNSRLLILGESYSLWMFNILILLLGLLAVFAFIKMWQAKKELKSNFFLWQLVFLFALIPYPFYMLWRGNHGYFFSYYLTPHFIFLVPIIILGIQEIVRVGQRIRQQSHIFFTPYLLGLAASTCIGVFGWAAWQHWDGVVFRPENNAGLAKMLAAVKQVYDWHQQDADNLTQPWVVKTYTANVYTEQYDYLFHWYGKTRQLPAPQTVLSGQEKDWYLVIESREHAQSIFFEPWYQTATQSGQKIREAQIGVLTLETWQK